MLDGSWSAGRVVPVSSILKEVLKKRSLRAETLHLVTNALSTVLRNASLGQKRVRFHCRASLCVPTVRAGFMFGQKRIVPFGTKRAFAAVKQPYPRCVSPTLSHRGGVVLPLPAVVRTRDGRRSGVEVLQVRRPGLTPPAPTSCFPLPLLLLSAAATAATAAAASDFCSCFLLRLSASGSLLPAPCFVPRAHRASCFVLLLSALCFLLPAPSTNNRCNAFAPRPSRRPLTDSLRACAPRPAQPAPCRAERRAARGEGQGVLNPLPAARAGVVLITLTITTASAPQRQ